MEKIVAEGYFKNTRNKVETTMVTAKFNSKTGKMYTIFGDLKAGNCV